MSIRLLISSDSLRNTTFSCDSMGIHYDVSKEGDIVSIYRWESKSNQKVLVGQIQFHLVSLNLNDKVRIGENGEWKKRKDVLTLDGGNFIARTFEGNDGVRYKWKLHWESLQLCYADKDGPNQGPLLVYHRNILPGKESYLEIRDTSILPTLDNIIVTFLIMEKKRREFDETAAA
ncbi:hypothetical protein PIIN_05081 [Serendipita indica DSM 11827]|uniref:DUF6593 domain-containing protein n=1 Tax=Serendipita indica (strain DSM 11827) TaxID=1109443 RepID=G4TIK2_SERID|nr:hypothetical protein PIIN_05081 [Serendipita indica DSM 11827]